MTVLNLSSISGSRDVTRINSFCAHKSVLIKLCFARKLETLYAVVAVFVDAYNRFGMEKYKYRIKRRTGELPFSVIDFI